MKVKALIRFNDYLEKTTRDIGEVFEVSEERYNQILKNGGLWVEKVETKSTKNRKTKGE